MLTDRVKRFALTTALHILIPLLVATFSYEPESMQVNVSNVTTGHSWSGFNALWIYYIILGTAFRGVWNWLGDLFDE